MIVKEESTDPTGVTVTDNNTCQGTPKDLTVTGGSLGTGADWQWYSDAALTTSAGNSATITVDPALTSYYYVRAEGDCNNTDTISVEVIVKEESTDPTGVTVTDNNTCQGTPKDLTVTGGSLGTGADWQWYSDAALTTPAGNSATITVDPAITSYYYVRAEGDCNNTDTVRVEVIVKEESTDPTGVTVTDNNTCQGTPKDLTVTGGSLGTGADWQWYSDAALTTPAGNSATITVDPAITSYYYVRAEGDCNITDTIRVEVIVKEESTDPTGVTVTDNNTCQGTPKDLTVTGGSLGTGADWQWYSDAALTTPAGNSATITVDPAITSYYYVRAEGDCNNTDTIRVEVIVKEESTDPTGVTVTDNNTCQGTPKDLTVTGGSLGTGADWQWYSDAALTTPAGNSATITVDPAITSYYYVRAEGDCNTTDTIRVEVIVKEESTDPTGVTVTDNNTCQGTPKRPGRDRRQLGTGADWYWYSDASLSTPAGTGTPISVDPAITQYYYVRAEGDCNTTDTIRVEVIVKEESTDPTGVTVTDNNTCQGTPKSLAVTGTLGTGADWYWYSDASLSTPAGTGTPISVDPAMTQYYYVRAEGDCNTTDTIRVEVIVKEESTDPTGVTVTDNNTCQGTPKSLAVTGTLGTGADWYWYSDASLSTPAGTGTPISVDPAITQYYYVRAEGDCNTTDTIRVEVIVKRTFHRSHGCNRNGQQHLPGYAEGPDRYRRHTGYGR